MRSPQRSQSLCFRSRPPVLLADGLRGGWTCHLVFKMRGTPHGYMRLGHDGKLTQLQAGVESGALLAVHTAWAWDACTCGL